MSTNPIWDYFTKVDSDAGKAQCNTCKKLLSLGNVKPKLQTNAGLKRHLAICHKEQNRNYMKSIMTNDESAAKKRKIEEETAQRKLPNFVQTSLPSMFNKSNAWPDDQDAVKRIDKCIMDLIIVDMLPYSVVESEAFKRLNLGDPLSTRRYNVKSEKYYRTTLMPATYDKVVMHVKSLLQKAMWVSFTTDIWSNPTKSCSLLSLTAHFIYEAARRKVVLNTMVLHEDHDGHYLASKLTKAVIDWDIEKKIHVGVRDNSANMKLALKVAGYTDVGCVSHTLQLVLNDALFTQPSVECIIKKARKIVSHFKHSEQACRHLIEHQQTVKLPPHSLLQDIATRWNSTFLMLERLTEQQKAINLYCVQRGKLDSMSLSEWELAEKIVKILRPFYTATLEICANDSCISVVIPLISNLLKTLDTAADHGIKQMKGALRDAIHKRFSNIKLSPPFIAATLLDPRFKEMYFTTQETLEAKKVVLDFLSAMHESTINKRSTSIQEIVTESSQTADVEGADLWDAHDSAISPSQKDQIVSISPYEEQLANYLNDPCLPRKTTNVYAYWASSHYPFLEAAALKYLSAPPTSAASEQFEQLFSAAGQLYADRRSNLQGENAEKMLFLNYNIRLFNYNY